MKRFLIFLCALLTAAMVVAAPSADNMVAAAKGGEWTHGQVQRILNRYADWKAAEPIQA